MTLAAMFRQVCVRAATQAAQELIPASSREPGAAALPEVRLAALRETRAPRPSRHDKLMLLRTDPGSG